MRPITPSIDPHAHRAAIDALEAQRAAYRRFARQAEARQAPLGAGDFDQVAAFTDEAAHTVSALHEGARAAHALVRDVSEYASEPQLRDMERRMDEMMREARNAETAIRNLTSQLEAWRDAYGRQLTELGITPGATEPSGVPNAGAPSDAADPAARAYAHRDAVRAPRILDRKG